MSDNKHGGNRPGSGRMKRTEKGLEPAVQFSGKVEQSVAQTCKQYFGTYAEALRFAARNATEIKKDDSRL